MRILFVCKYNRFRSQIAESFFNYNNKNKNIVVESAGTEIKFNDLDTFQKNIVSKLGIKMDGIPKEINFEKLNEYDKIIIVANDVPSSLFSNVESYKIERWEIEDEQNGNIKNIIDIARKIKKNIKRLLKNLKNFPSVSVIIPLYNSEKYIEETVLSVLNQTYQNFEIIIYDDCSKDKGYDVVKEMEGKDSRIRVFRNSENSGKAKTVNNAFKKVRGNFICILDADDLFAKDKLQKQVEFLGKNPKIDLVYGNMVSFDESGKEDFVDAIKFRSLDRPYEIMKKRARNISCWVRERVYRIFIAERGVKRYIPASSVMFRKKILDFGIKMDPNLRNSEDYDFWFNIVGHKFKIGKLNHITYKYRIHSGQKSGNNEKMFLARDYVMKKLSSGEYFK